MTVLLNSLTTPVCADAAIPSEWLFDTTTATAAPTSSSNTGSGFPGGMLLIILLLTVAAAVVLTGVLIARHKKVTAAPAVRDNRTDSHE